MELVLYRTERTEQYTGGVLYRLTDNPGLPQIPICQTLEDPVRPITTDGKGKIKGKTAIPEGTYRLVLSRSSRFKKVMPELLEVPHFSGIRIHTGNTVADTDGCLLVGTRRVKGYLSDSRPAYTRLLLLLDQAHGEKEKITITIVNA